MTRSAPRVFISYAHDSADHQALVRRFYELLRRECGVDARLDVSAAQAPQNWANWTEQEIALADFVLCIASPGYRMATESETPPEVRRGARWEQLHLKNAVYADERARRTILPVVLPGGSVEDIPRWMNPATTTHYRVSGLSREGVDDLLRYLLDQPDYPEPAIGVARPSADDLAERNVDLPGWRRHVARRTAELWVSGARAPLRAAERDTDEVLRDLHLTADLALLHRSTRQAASLIDGEEIILGADLEPGQLFELLEFSVLIVGRPGAGKSVLLWQLARDLLAAPKAETGPAVPLVLELHRWLVFDPYDGRSDKVPPTPRFDEFVAAELARPALGVPREVTLQLLRTDSMILLLDGLDELDDRRGVRCLASLALFNAGHRHRRLQIALTCRDLDYRRLVEHRDAHGTAAVANALRIVPLSAAAVGEILDMADPPAGRLTEVLEQRAPLQEMVGLPLWLSVAYLVFRTDPATDPLARLGLDAGEEALGSALYEQWRPLRLDRAPPQTQDELAGLAYAMTRSGQLTLYLESVGSTWASTLLDDLPVRVRRRVRWVSSALAAVLLLPILWSIDGAYGLAAGVVFAILAGSLTSWAMVDGEAHLVTGLALRRGANPGSVVRPAGLGLAAGLVTGVLWGLANGWGLSLSVGGVVATLVGSLGWVGGAVRETESAPEPASLPRSALRRTRRIGIAATVGGTLLCAPPLALIFSAAVRLAEEHVLVIGGLEFDGRLIALLVLPPPVVAIPIARRWADEDQSGWSVWVTTIGWLVLAVGLAGTVGLLLGAVAEWWLGFPGALARAGIIGALVGACTFTLVFPVLSWIGLTEQPKYAPTYTTIPAFLAANVALFAFASPEAAEVLGAAAGLTAGLVVGLRSGLGRAIGHRLTLRVCARFRLLPRGLPKFLDQACELGVMYPSGPGFRFRHRTLAEMLANRHFSARVVARR